MHRERAYRKDGGRHTGNRGRQVHVEDGADSGADRQAARVVGQLTRTLAVMQNILVLKRQRMPL
jgi:hypothetical protein